MEDRERDLEREVDELHRAVASREVIGMALGLLMAWQNCTPEEAFDLLRQQSQHQNVKLRELAAELVCRHVSSVRDGDVGRPPPRTGA